MSVTTPGAYLLIARYNREKWNSLKKSEAAEATATRAVGFAADQSAKHSPPPKESQIDEQHQAHEQAEDLFPENYYPLPQLTPEERKSLPRPISKPDTHPPKFKGVRMICSFHTNMFAALHEKIPNIEKQGEGTSAATLGASGTESQKTPSQIVDDIMTAPGTGQKDPGIGWLAVVDAGDFTAFVKEMGGKAGPLWRMYDIEVLPLNKDQTTWDIYKFMTPVSWSK